MNYNEIKNKFKDELKAVDCFIINNLKSDSKIVEDIGDYITLCSGKKIRPLLAILFGKMMFNCEKEVILMSSVIELIHTATLLHDDVIDLSCKRRNKLSVNNIWSNKESVLVGDFLYTKSFQLMVSINNIQILKLMSKITNIMSEGEITQLIFKNNYNITEKDYFKIIISKTAKLFEAAALIAPILCNLEKKNLKIVSDFGLNFGIAYQLIDDMLDYTADNDIFGKKTGIDILNGNFTLPLIYLMENDKEKKNIIKNIILNNNDTDYYLIKKYVMESNALNYTFNLAEKHITLAKKNLNMLNDNKYKIFINDLTDFVINREY